MEYGTYILLSLILSVILFFYSKRKNRITYIPSTDISNLSAYSDIESLPFTYQIPEVSLVALNPEKISYIQTKSQLNSIIPNLSISSHIGIDIEESRENSYIGYICLIQISTLENIYLIDTLKLRSEILLLKPIFSNSQITKIFHGAHNDTQWLYRDFGIVCVNVFDTQIAGKFLGLKKLGLNYLWKKYCKFVMASEYKKKMQTSRWDLRPLSKEQIVYGAQDAAYLLYLMKVLIGEMSDEMIRSMREETNKICMKKFDGGVTEEKCLEVLKKHAGQAIDSQAIYIFEQLFKLRDQIAQQMDSPVGKLCSNKILSTVSLEKPQNPASLLKISSQSLFLSHSNKKILEIINTGLSHPLEILKESSLQSQSLKEKKQKRYETFIERFTIKGKVFENCQIQKPNGEILCYADSKKSNWYLNRDLALIIQDSPLIIRLKFEPNMKNISQDEVSRMFSKKEKRNECICCGNQGSFLRYRVVPLLYRQFFTDEIKNLCRHDVVLLCAMCHEATVKHCEAFKKEIADEFGVPLNYYSEKYKLKEELTSIRKICVSLKKNGLKIPEDRKEVLKIQVKKFVEVNQEFEKFFEGKDLNQIVEFLSVGSNCKKLLMECEGVDWKKEMCDNHGKKVVEQVKDFPRFIMRWKLNFIKTMTPKFLPDSWKANPEIDACYFA